ncbi:tail fiber protein, partial [Photorhabdus sp. S9-53]
MAKNEFLTFGIAEGANVLSNEEYAALAARVNGFSAGVAKSRELNKAWRQSSIITHILADFIAKESGNDVLDNGNIDALKNSMALAIKNALPEMRDASLIEKGITQLTDKTGNSNTLAATQKLVSDVNDNANSKLAKSQNGADIPNKSEFVKNLGLAETGNLAKNAVPNSRKINGKALTGDISLSAGDVGAFKLGSTGSVPRDVAWNADTGLYAIQAVTYSSHVAHFNNGTGSCPAFQLRVLYKNRGIAYRSARDNFGFEEDWSELATLDDINVPVGVPLPYPHRYTPAGYLTCNGQSFDKSLYPKLAEAYPAGRVPDLRGEFIRGWDDSRGVDPGRVCGTWQGDSTKRIQLAEGNADSRYMSLNQGSVNGYCYPLGRDVKGNATDTSIANNTGGNETRPRNVA